MTCEIISEGMFLSQSLYVPTLQCSDCPTLIAIDREFERVTYIEAKCPDCFVINYQVIGARNASL